MPGTQYSTTVVLVETTSNTVIDERSTHLRSHNQVKYSAQVKCGSGIVCGAVV